MMIFWIFTLGKGHEARAHHGVSRAVSRGSSGEGSRYVRGTGLG